MKSKISHLPYFLFGLGRNSWRDPHPYQIWCVYVQRYARHQTQCHIVAHWSHWKAPGANNLCPKVVTPSMGICVSFVFMGLTLKRSITERKKILYHKRGNSVLHTSGVKALIVKKQNIPKTICCGLHAWCSKMFIIFFCFIYIYKILAEAVGPCATSVVGP